MEHHIEERSEARMGRETAGRSKRGFMMANRFSSVVARLARTSKRSLVVALLALLVIGAAVPAEALAAGHHAAIPLDGQGDSPLVP
jgi:hypothetical protein